MSTAVQVEGNLLEKPVSRVVKVGDGTEVVTEFRIMSDTRKRVGDEWVQDDEKTYPVNVTMWGKKRGEDIMRLLHVGVRVMVHGDQHLRHFTPNEEQAARGLVAKTSVEVVGNYVGLSLGRIKSLEMFPSKATEAARDAASEAAAATVNS